MTNLTHDLDILDAHIGVFDYRNVLRVDRALTILVVVLAGIGLVTLFSASRSATSAVPFYIKQAVWLALGVGAAVAIISFDHRFLVSLGPIMYVAAIVLLGWVELAGATAKGGQRWLELGPIRFQPSEPAKLALVYMLAWYLSTIRGRVRRLPYLLLAFLIAGVPAVFILSQPNLGTALTLVPAAFVMLYVAGCKRRHMAMVIVVGLAVAPVVWNFLEDYQKKRVVTFFNPSSDPQGKGWHVIQTKTAVGSGQLLGKGFRQGTQTHLSYLPEHHTDFIFALLAEENGFVGSVVVIGLFAALLLRGLELARRCQDMAGVLLATGAVTILGFHVFVNIAITIGLMPVTGIPLPFLSYGGSFYLTAMMCVGAVLSVNARKGLFDSNGRLSAAQHH